MKVPGYFDSTSTVGIPTPILFGYAVANEVCRPWAVFQSHSCYGWETVALYSSGILRHLLSWRWGSPFTSYTYISGFYRAGRPGVSRRPARWFLYFTQRKKQKMKTFFLNSPSLSTTVSSTNYFPALPAPGSVWVSPRVCPIENARWGVNRLVLSLSVGANKAGIPHTDRVDSSYWEFLAKAVLG